MELGITGRRAAVAAASSGLGLASAAALAVEGVLGGVDILVPNAGGPQAFNCTWMVAHTSGSCDRPM